MNQQTVQVLDEVEIVQLRRENAEMAAALARAEEALVRQEMWLLDGYVIAVWPVGDGTFIAKCPTLHAAVQEPSREGAVDSLREAMALVRRGHEGLGRPVPPKDVPARCLD